MRCLRWVSSIFSFLYYFGPLVIHCDPHTPELQVSIRGERYTSIYKCCCHTFLFLKSLENEIHAVSLLIVWI